MLRDMCEFMSKKNDATSRTESGAEAEQPEMRAVVSFKLCCMIQANRDVLGSGELDEPGTDFALPDLQERSLKMALRFCFLLLANRDRLINDTQAVLFGIGNESLDAIPEGSSFLGGIGSFSHATCDLRIDGLQLRQNFSRGLTGGRGPEDDGREQIWDMPDDAREAHQSI